MLQVIRPIERLTIVAMGRSVNDYIAYLYSNPEPYGEVWTVNSGGLMFRHDVLWDMHTAEYINALPDADKERVWKRRVLLESHDRPVVMPQANPVGIPTSVTFPLKEVVDLTQANYFNNGTAYMLATALCCKVKRLSLFGVDFVGERFERERACAMYWLGRLMESGCRLGPCSSTELTDSLRRHSGTIYGYHEPITFEYGGVEPVFSGPDYG